MGNECDQCQQVTQGCKRQQLRQQLKTRQKLNIPKNNKINSIDFLQSIPYHQSTIKQINLQINQKFQPPLPPISLVRDYQHQIGFNKRSNVLEQDKIKQSRLIDKVSGLSSDANKQNKRQVNKIISINKSSSNKNKQTLPQKKVKTKKIENFNQRQDHNSNTQQAFNPSKVLRDFNRQLKQPQFNFENSISDYDQNKQDEEKIKNQPKDNKQQKIKVSLQLVQGSRFVGFITKQKQLSYGTLTHKTGQSYRGSFVQNKPHGQGTQTYIDGSSYKGEFILGTKNGHGIYTKHNLHFSGCFTLNQPNGPGSLTFNNHLYKGTFLNGKLQGKAIIKYSNGDIYQGQVKDFIKDGKGKYSFRDGRIWQGQWKGNRQYGWGVYKDIMGNVGEGCWVDGIKQEDNIVSFSNIHY